MRGPRAHLAGKDDELAMVAPLVALIPVFAALLDMRAEAAMTNRIARAPIIGRPVGAPEWIATRERRLLDLRIAIAVVIAFGAAATTRSW